MSETRSSEEPADAAERRAVPPIVCYDVEELPPYDAGWFGAVRRGAKVTDSVLVGPRTAETFAVAAGQFFRIVSVDGPQVGDLNLWNAHDLSERFYSGKTRQFHATHITEGDRLWSTHPNLRPLATITHDSLGWYGFDEHGGGIHDVIGRPARFGPAIQSSSLPKSTCWAPSRRVLAATAAPGGLADRSTQNDLSSSPIGQEPAR